MREHKIVILGPMGAGKSTLVRAVAGGAVVDTDVINTDTGSGKKATTVAMDYADLNLPNGDRIRLVGTPGQARFDFVWPILLAGASGAVVLIDATRQDAVPEFERALHALEKYAPKVPTVAGLTKSDLSSDDTIDACHDSLRRNGRTLPVVPLDARDDSQILMLMDILMSEIETSGLVTPHA